MFTLTDCNDGLVAKDEAGRTRCVIFTSDNRRDLPRDEWKYNFTGQPFTDAELKALLAELPKE